MIEAQRWACLGDSTSGGQVAASGACFRGSLRSLAVVFLTLIQNRIFPIQTPKTEGDQTTEICAASRPAPCLEIHNATRLVSAVCYHAARPGHTIDRKRVVDATVPMALTLWVCWTCQPFTDIAWGRGRDGKRRVASRAGGPRCPKPGPKPKPHHLHSTERGFHVFWGCAVCQGLYWRGLRMGIGDAAWEACFKFICGLGSKRLVAADSGLSPNRCGLPSSEGP